MKKLYYIILIAIIGFSFKVLGQSNKMDLYYELINDMEFKHNDDTINNRYYLNENTRNVKLSFDVLKDFSKFLNEEQIVNILNQPIDSNHLKWKPERLIKSTVLNFEQIDSKEINGYYLISNPIFTNDLKFAVVERCYFCGSLCGKGCVILYQKKESKWEPIAATLCWIS